MLNEFEDWSGKLAQCEAKLNASECAGKTTEILLAHFRSLLKASSVVINVLEVEEGRLVGGIASPGLSVRFANHMDAIEEYVPTHPGISQFNKFENPYGKVIRSERAFGSEDDFKKSAFLNEVLIPLGTPIQISSLIGKYVLPDRLGGGSSRLLSVLTINREKRRFEDSEVMRLSAQLKHIRRNHYYRLDEVAREVSSKAFPHEQFGTRCASITMNADGVIRGINDRARQILETYYPWRSGMESVPSEMYCEVLRVREQNAGHVEIFPVTSERLCLGQIGGVSLRMEVVQNHTGNREIQIFFVEVFNWPPNARVLEIEDLSPEQVRILVKVLQGKSSKEIAMELGTSPNAIECQRHRILFLLGLKTVKAPELIATSVIKPDVLRRKLLCN